MSETVTKPLTDSEKLNLILAGLTDLRAWRARVGAFIDERTRGTRPMLDLIHKQLADTRLDLTELVERVARIERKFDHLIQDNFELRSAQRELDTRIARMEHRPS